MSTIICHWHHECPLAGANCTTVVWLRNDGFVDTAHSEKHDSEKLGAVVTTCIQRRREELQKLLTGWGKPCTDYECPERMKETGIYV